MSFRKAVLSYAAALAVVAFTGMLVTKVVPLRAQAVATEQADVRVEGARLLDRAMVLYPMSAWKSGVEGVVTCEANIGVNGEVVDARVISGPHELRRAALSALLGWRFDEGQKTAQVYITFRRPQSFGDSPSGKMNFEISERVPANTLESLRLRLRDFDGLSYTPTIIPRLAETIRSASPLLGLRVNHGPDGTVTLHIEPSGGSPSYSVMSSGTGQPVPNPPSRIRVGPGVQALNLVEMAAPAYPALAKQARIQGTVRFNVDIGKDGGVTSVQAYTGHPLLIPAAMEAVRKYRYKPTMLNGNPVEVSTQVEVHFTLD